MRKHDHSCRALANLEEGSRLPEPYNIAERTGMAALFQACFEQGWKLAQEVLPGHGWPLDKLRSPRPVIKPAWQQDLVSDGAAWLGMMETRNLLAHTYSYETGDAAVSRVKSTFIAASRELKKRIDTDWTLTGSGS